MSDIRSVDNESNYRMESGDYIIQCHIIEGRELKGDPVVTMNIGDTKKNTSIKKNQENVKWDEVFTLNLPKKSKRELDQTTLNIFVHDANTLTRNELIGAYSFELTDIYFQKHHEYFRHWIAISNDNEMTGFIHLTICVLGPNDEQCIHSKQEIMHDNGSIVLTNPAVPRISYCLKINIFDLHDIDSKNPFVSVEYGCTELHSKKGNHTNDIRCSFEIPVIEPIFTKNIKICVWDQDILHQSKPIATLFFNYREIKQKYNGELPPSYWYLYGAPNDDNLLKNININADITDNEIATRMNNGVMDGICFKGRILLQISIHETKRKHRKRIRENINGLLQHELPPTKPYTLRCDLYQGYVGNKCHIVEDIIKPSYYISVSIGCRNIHSKEHKLKDDTLCIEWNQMIDIPPIEISQDILQTGDKITNIPHIFIYLYCKSAFDVSLLAYAKLSLLDIIDGNSGLITPKWIDLKPNEVSPKNIPFPSAVSLCLNDAKHSEIKSITPLQPPVSRTMQLRCYIFKGRNIKTSSDLFLEISFGGKTVKTNVCETLADPYWFETLIINCEVSMDTNPRIYAQLLENDLFSNSVFGRFHIAGDEAMITYKNEKEPFHFEHMEPYIKQYQLCDANGESVGESRITACFHLITNQQAHYPLLSSDALQQMMNQQRQQTYIHIITLGLRQLNSAIYIHNPFIMFEINDKCFATKQSKHPSTRNPNYNQHIPTMITLPARCKQFMPNLKLMVKDFLFGGYLQRDIAYAHIELDEAYDLRDNDEEHDEEHKYKDDDCEIINDFDHKPAHKAQQSADDKERFSIDVEWENIIQIGNISETTPLIDKKEEEEDGDNRKCNPNGARLYEYTKRLDSKYDLKLPTPQWLRDREIYQKALEDTCILRDKPFVSFPIHSLHSDRTVGYFKGNIFLSDSRTLDESHNETIQKLKQKKNLYLRVYVLKCHNLTGADSNGSVDPYLKLKYGASKVSTRAKHLSNDCNPLFYESFQFAMQMPGTSALEISVMDFDGFNDDLIGKTVIDVEDRYFSRKWQSIRLKPIESRSLYISNSNAPQGKIEIMLDIIEASHAKQTPLLNITPLAPISYELRAIVWKTKDIPIADPTTNNNDLFVKCVLDEDTQSTDTHFRCKGFGSFNWRFVWNLNIPSSNYEYDHLCVEVWDKDIFSFSDSICKIYLTELSDFYHFAYKVNEENRYWNAPLQKVLFTYKGYNKFWVHMDEENGAIEMSFELVPNPLCKKIAAGKGRQEPNLYPHLQIPECRLKFNILNPYQTIRNVLGDQFIAKCWCLICLIAGCALLLFMLPSLLASLMANIMTP